MKAFNEGIPQKAELHLQVQIDFTLWNRRTVWPRDWRLIFDPMRYVQFISCPDFRSICQGLALKGVPGNDDNDLHRF